LIGLGEKTEKKPGAGKKQKPKRNGSEKLLLMQQSKKQPFGTRRLCP
jgi:hypothetical protein